MELEYPIIRSNNIILKFPDICDLDDLYEIYSDSESMSSLSLEPVDKTFFYKTFLYIKNEEFKKLKELYFGIYSIEKKVVGFIDLHYFDFAWNIDYCINPKYRNKGYCKSALKLLFQFCKDSGVKELKAIVQDSNCISIHILEKLGFEIYNKKMGLYNHKTEISTYAIGYKKQL